ncbi:MAG: hypothetical protein K9K93_07075 [Acholeplasmataceae bacterium]|nr:hypothetical protein [Acholeplasmataceae bacterium]
MSRTVIDCVTKHDLDQAESLLSASGLLFEHADETILIAEDGKVLATGSIDGNVIKMIAVDPSVQGQELASEIVAILSSRLQNEGIDKRFLYTTPDKKDIFLSMSFDVVQETSDVILLENAANPIRRRLSQLASGFPKVNQSRAAIVMNCNPITNGHLYLIRKASVENNDVLIFLVEEDASFVPFEIRKRLLESAVKDLFNVYVIPSTPYIISKATFPTYFLKEVSKSAHLYRELDVLIFKTYFMPIFGITTRYVGDEPNDLSTNLYNETLKNHLKDQLKIVSRLDIDHVPVSASMVRALAKAGAYEKIGPLVPKATYDYIISEEGRLLFGPKKTP